LKNMNIAPQVTIRVGIFRLLIQYKAHDIIIK
jgi:hypothetical protein